MLSEGEAGPSVIRKIGKAILYFMFFAVAIPLALGWIFGVSAISILSLIVAAILLQAGAPAFASVFNLNPPAVIITMACFALGMVLAIREACESLALSSVKVRNWIETMKKKTETYPQIGKFGPVSCTLIAWIPGIGLYGTPIISWLLQWKKSTSTFFTVLGFVIASIFVLFFMSYLPAFIEIFLIVAILGAAICAVATMFSMAFTFTIPRIRSSLADHRFMVLALAANFLLVPLAAYFITMIPTLTRSYATGLLVIALAAGGTFLLKFTSGAKGNVDRVSGLMVLPTLVTVAAMPIALPFLAPAGSTDQAKIAVTLILLILVPLGLALFLRSRSEAVTTAWAPLATKISAIGLGAILAGFLGALVIGLIAGVQLVPRLPGSGVLLAALSFLLVSFGVGYLLGGPSAPDRWVLGLGTGQRNLAAASAVATFCFLEPYNGRLLSLAPDMEIATMVTVTGLAGIILFTYLGKYRAKKGE